jgi:hypothetical protein
MYEGTGSAPTNGFFGPAGTAIGSAEIQRAYLAGGGGATAHSYMPFCVTAYVTGLTPGVAVWFDIQLTPTTNGSLSQISSVYVMAIEE